MTENTSAPKAPEPVTETGTKAVDPVTESIAALEARITELENVVHKLAPIAPAEYHGVILPWLERIGARIKAAL